MDNKKIILSVLFLLIFVSVSFWIFGAWNGAVQTYGVGGTGSFGMPVGSAVPGASRDSYAETYKSVQGAPQSQNYNQNPLTARKIVKNGSLSLLVSKVEEAAAKIGAISSKFGGFVSDSQVHEISKGKKSGNVTIRVPADKFDEAMNELKGISVKVERENTNSQDVTEQFIDLESTIRNLKAEEAQYQKIMKQANTVEDILRVSERLASVRGRIESAEGSLKYLSRQVDISSITVSLTAEEDVEILGIRWRPLVQAKQALRDMILGVTNFVDIVLSFVIFIPLILLWTATVFFLALGLWKLANRIKAKYFT